MQRLNQKLKKEVVENREVFEEYVKILRTKI